MPATLDAGIRRKVCAVERRFLQADFRRGTLAPARRAFDRPMAIACLRFLCSPRFRCVISVFTSFCALAPYFLRPVARVLRRLLAEVFARPRLAVVRRRLLVLRAVV